MTGPAWVAAAARSRAAPAAYSLSVIRFRGVWASRCTVAATVASESAVTGGPHSGARAKVKQAHPGPRGQVTGDCLVPSGKPGLRYMPNGLERRRVCFVVPDACHGQPASDFV
jgi:hypothetical protein